MKLDTFTLAYIECMLWSESAEIEPYTDRSYQDHGYGISDLDAATLARIIADCDRFQSAFAGVIDDDEQAGHDFWLDRVGHGAGALDRDCECSEHHLPSQCPRNIIRHAGARCMGHVDIYLGDDGQIYMTPDPEDAAAHARRLDREKCALVADYLAKGGV